MLGHTPLAPLAVLAPQRRSDHTRHAEVALVKLPLPDQLVNGRLLLRDAPHLGHKARVEHHRARVEVRRQREAHGEAKVEPRVGVGVRWVGSEEHSSLVGFRGLTGREWYGGEAHGVEPVEADKEERASEDAR